jgi:hypothetical protein
MEGSSMTPEQRERLRKATNDVAKLKSGWRPGEADMSSVAFIDQWMIATEPGIEGWSLYGRVIAHERIGEDRMTRTSPVLWLDTEAGLARTVSRWYRLGTPHPRQVEAMTPPDDETPIPIMNS